MAAACGLLWWAFGNWELLTWIDLGGKMHRQIKPKQPAQQKPALKRQPVIRHVRNNHGSNPVDLWVVGAGELG